ncbi:MAG: hypothetical protein AB7O45_17610, partial [Alphaproteobacteria bacterium]
MSLDPAAGPPPAPFDAALVIPTVLRPTLLEAVRSVYAQDLGGRIQLLIGIDRREGSPDVIDRLRAECPSHVGLAVWDPGYSLNRASGGIYEHWHGGPLRAALTYLAHSRFVAYLDDDNWLAPNHLSSLRNAIDGVGWAYSLRHVIDPGGVEIGVDRWLSIGPDPRFAPVDLVPFADTSTLMVNKVRCHRAIGAWMEVDEAKKAMEDRLFSRALQRLQPGRGTGLATVYYRTRRENEGIVIAARQNMPPTRRPKVGLREALRRLPTIARATRPTPGAAAGWPEDDPPIARMVRQLRPQTVLAAGGARATAALAIARELAAIGGDRLLAVIDTWHPRLVDLLQADDPKPLQWHGGVAAPLDSFLAAVRQHDVDWAVVPLAQPPSTAARYLQGVGVTVDMAVVDASESEEETLRLLADYWPLVRPGGVLVGTLHPRDGVNHRRPVERFAAEIELAPRFRVQPDGRELFAFRIRPDAAEPSPSERPA